MPSRHGRAGLHFLRISKTGSTTLTSLVAEHRLRDIAQDRPLVMHGHQISMPEVLQNPQTQVVFFLRHPLSRFVSGFNHRREDVPTRRKNARNAREQRSLQHFESANDLAEAITSNDETTQDRAYASMKLQMHAALHLTHWLVSRDYLERRAHRIAFLGFQETFQDDIRRFVQVLGDQRELVIPHERRAADTAPRHLSELAETNLRRWYAADIAIYEWAQANRDRWMTEVVGAASC